MLLPLLLEYHSSPEKKKKYSSFLQLKFEFVFYVNQRALGFLNNW